MNRIVTGVIAALACGFGIWQAARAGVARNLALDAASRNDLAAAQRAVRWLPQDAATHTARGMVLERTENYGDAVKELERAAQLRPRDYFPWMLLGVTRDLNGDQTGAVRALRQSIAAAPAYAKPHWLFGNLLLRTGQVDEAFRELRFAAASDNRYLSNVIDLAWGVARNDPSRTISLVQPQTDAVRMSLAIYFAGHNARGQAIEQFRATTNYSDESANSLLTEMFRAGMFTEAFEVWRRTHGISAATPSLLNGGFEEEITVGQTGFGWQIRPVPEVTLSVDMAQHQSGSHSLRLDFKGTATPAPLVSQIVLVKPNTKYRLIFQAVSKDLVSAGPPLVTVSDADTRKPQLLGQSPPLHDLAAWHEYPIEFVTGSNTEAITVTISLQACPNQPCPIIGTLWLDSFQLVTR